MFDAIKRVISGDDVRFDDSGETGDVMESEQSTHQHDDSIRMSSEDIRYAALIENDMDVDVTGDTANTPGSSLSDMSATRRGSEAIKASNSHEKFTRRDSKMSNTDSSSASMKASSQTSSRDWGWFEDVHTAEHNAPSKKKDKASSKSIKKKGKIGGGLGFQPETTPAAGLETILLYHQPTTPDDAAAMAVTAPTYVLEESLSSQKLWKNTAGNRPPQPVEERAWYEKKWAENFVRSEVEYRIPVEVLTATTPIADDTFDPAGGTDFSSGGPKIVKGPGSEGDVTILVQGDNVFGTTVSKSFARSSEIGGPVVVDTVNISIASYRVVESKKHGKYAQFLVIYREGSIRDTFGIWKRYSDFQELSKKITQAHEGCASVIANMSPLAVTEEHDVEHLPNAITSWRLLKKRQRWYRCLDAGYLSLKVFLLERFLHDILFESSSPNLLQEFTSPEEILEVSE